MRRSYRSYNTGTATGITLIIISLVLFVLGIIGWVLNIIHLFNMPTVLTGEGAVRIAGIPVAPLGAILGWFF